jgi:hypothetical protein
MQAKPCGPRRGLTGQFLILGDYLYVECNMPVGVFVYNKHDRRLASPIFSLTGPFGSASFIAAGP